MDRREDRGGPGRRQKWGGRQAEPAAGLEPSGEGIKSLGAPPRTELPRPQHAAASPVREACFFSMVAWPSPLLTPAPPAALPPIKRVPCRALYKGFHLCDSSPEAGQPGTPGYRLGQKGPQRAGKVGRRRACIVPACCQPSSPTGSRRHVADVREDKGRHGPHQPPVIEGLCLLGGAGGQRPSFSSSLHAPPPTPPPASKSFSWTPQASGPGAGSRQGS